MDMVPLTHKRQIGQSAAYEAAYRSEEGALGVAFVNYFAHFGYGKVPFRDMVSSGFLNVGTISDVKRPFNSNPGIWYGVVLLVYRAGCDGVG